MLRGATRWTFWVACVCLLFARTPAAGERAVASAGIDADRHAALIAGDDSSQSQPEDVAASTPVGVALTDVLPARAPGVTTATIRSADVDCRSSSLPSPLGPRPPPSR